MNRVIFIFLLTISFISAKNAFDYYKEAKELHIKGEYQNSIVTLKKSLNLLNKKDLVGHAMVYYALGINYTKLEKFKKSIEYLLEALKYKNQINPYNRDTIDLYYIISDIYNRLHDLKNEAKYYRLGLNKKIKIYGKYNKEIANDYSYLALIYSDMGEYNQTVKLLLKSIQIAKKLNSKLKLANYYNNLSDTYIYLGDYKKAFKYIQKSIDIRENKLGKKHPNTITAYHNLASIYLYLGNFKKALEYETKAKDGINHFNTMTNIFAQQGKLKEALKYAVKSLKIREKKFGEAHLQTAQAYHNVGTIYNDMYQHQKALFYIKKAISYNSLAQIYLSKKEYSKALNYAKKSLDGIKNYFGERHPKMVMNYQLVGAIYSKLSKSKEAYRYIKKGYDIDTLLRKSNFSILDKKEKLAYIKNNKLFLSALMYITFLSKNQKYTKETFDSWLNYKRVIFDNENSLKLIYNKNKSKIDELYQTQRELARLYQNIPQKNLKEYNQQIKKTQKQISQLERTLTIDTKNNISSRDIANLLKSNQLYIDFAKIKDNYYYFILDNYQNITFNKIDINQTKEIDKTVEYIRRDITKRFNSIKTKGFAKLYNIIFKNIDIKDKTSLIISPDGLLGLIPFEAFYIKKEQKYLIEKVDIQYIPSGKELVQLYQDNTKPKSNIVVFANPNFGLNIKKQKNKFRCGTIEALYNQAKTIKKINNFFSSLLGSKKEADTIGLLFRDNKPKIFIGDKANEKNLLDIQSPKILHLATHGFFIKDKSILNPMLKTGVALSGANYAIATKTGEGIITGLELSGINLNGTELVVLSACETGVGEIEEAEGIAGLSKAFIKAGAKNVIMSLWSVDDEATATLMEKFYTNIKSGKNYTQALKDAKLFMIKNNNSNPFYWAGFIKSGIHINMISN